MRPAIALGIALLAGIAVLEGAAQAQSAARRDPTQPPPGYGPAAPTPRDPLEAFKPEHLVTVDGQRYLMWQGRRYRVGDTLQGARIERIEESEVWLRTGAGIRKLPLYPRIEKRPTTSAAQAAVAGQSATTKGQGR